MELVKINQAVEQWPKADDKHPVHTAGLQADIVLARVFSRARPLPNHQQPDQSAENMKCVTADDRVKEPAVNAAR